MNKICIIPNAPKVGYNISTNLEKPMGEIITALITITISHI